MSLTEKQQKYVKARLEGKSKVESAIFAGIPEKSASSMASKYEKNKKIIDAFSRHIAFSKPLKADKSFIKAANLAENINTDVKPENDPLKYLERVMNDELSDPKLRLEAAKALARHTSSSKDPAKGKKEERNDAAKEAIKGKFSPSAPPLTVVKK